MIESILKDLFLVPFLVVALYAIGICVLGMIFCNYMLRRNDKIYEFRLNMIKEDFNHYEKLPSYDYMLWYFWVWTLDKFLSKEKKHE
jgi:hypothetical protein